MCIADKLHHFNLLWIMLPMLHPLCSYLCFAKNLRLLGINHNRHPGIVQSAPPRVPPPSPDLPKLLLPDRGVGKSSTSMSRFRPSICLKNKTLQSKLVVGCLYKWEVQEENGFYVWSFCRMILMSAFLVQRTALGFRLVSHNSLWAMWYECKAKENKKSTRITSPRLFPQMWFLTPRNL